MRGFVESAVLSEVPDEMGYITFQSGASISFVLGHDPEMTMSGHEEPDYDIWEG